MEGRDVRELGGYEGSAVLPEEVLEMIFSHLENPRDLVNVSQTSTQFERILCPSSVTWLFNEVLPFIYVDLDRSDIFSIRTTCKKWKESVTNLLDNHYSFRPHDHVLDWDMTPIARQYRDKLPTSVLDDVGAIKLGPVPEIKNALPPEVWLGKMGDHHGNPFVLKHVETYSIDYGNSGPVPWRHFWKHTFSFLRDFGTYILSFTMVFQDRKRNYVAFYKTLRKCLQMLPNLRTLHLNESDTYVLGLYDNLNIQDPQFQRLPRYIKKYPLPDLPSLSEIIITIRQFTIINSKRAIVEELFRQYQGQLKKVKIDPDMLYELGHLEQQLGLFFGNETSSTLTELHLKVNCSAWDCNILHFNTHMNTFPNLGKLTIKIAGSATDHNIQTIMESMQKFPALKIVNLEFSNSPKISNFESRRRPSVRLSSVRVLDICYLVSHYFPKWSIYDAILCYVPCLEYLHIDHPKEYHAEKARNDRSDQIFTVMEGLRSGNLYQYNLWEQLKCLKAVSFCESSIRQIQEGQVESLCCVTRENYEQLNKMA